MKKIILPVLLGLCCTSCTSSWNEDDKKSFYQACSDEAKTWAGSDAKVKTYCDCVFEKLEKKFPDENDALEHIAVLANDTDLINCKKEVMK